MTISAVYAVHMSPSTVILIGVHVLGTEYMNLTPVATTLLVRLALFLRRQSVLLIAHGAGRCSSAQKAESDIVR